MKFELYGENKVHLIPGGYYNLNEDNNTELMVVKLALLQAHIDAAIDQVAESSEEPKSLTNGSDIMKLADTIYAKYQQDIESGNKKMFEQSNVYINKGYDYMHPNANKESFKLEIIRGSEYTFTEAQKDGAIYTQNYNSMDEVKAAMKGALQSSDCINMNQSNLAFRVNGREINSETFEFKPTVQPLPEIVRDTHPLDGWKPATCRSTCNIQGAEYEKMYGGIDGAVLFEMTIAERDGKYIPYHGSIAMPECETIIQAAKAIDTYYNKLAPGYKYTETQMMQLENPQLYKFQIRGYEESHPYEYMIGLGTIENPSFQTIDNNSFFTGNMKLETSRSILTNKADFDVKSDCYRAWNGVNGMGDGYGGYSVSVTSLPITNITLVQQQEQTTPYSKLSPTEVKELNDFTTAVKNNYPEAKPQNFHQLCTIASDMAKYTMQNANGTLSDVSFNALTDAQERQIKDLLVKDLPGVKCRLDYAPHGPAIQLRLPKGPQDTLYPVPEIFKNKLVFDPKSTSTKYIGNIYEIKSSDNDSIQIKVNQHDKSRKIISGDIIKGHLEGAVSQTFQLKTSELSQPHVKLVKAAPDLSTAKKR